MEGGGGGFHLKPNKKLSAAPLWFKYFRDEVSARVGLIKRSVWTAAVSGHMLQPGACELQHRSLLGKHGPQSWRHNNRETRNTSCSCVGGPRAASGQPADESTTFKFARVRKRKKKKAIFYSRSLLESRAARARSFSSPYRAFPGGGSAGGRHTVDGSWWFFCLSSPPSCYCRLALTSRPRHGSMLAFLLPASRDPIAAQLGGMGPNPRR